MSTGQRIRLIAIAEIPPGTVRRFMQPGRPALAIYNVGGAFFVTSDTCTHGMASLSEGTLDGDVIECPWHAGAFNVRTGAVVSMPCTDPIKTYAAIVEDGTVFVELG